MKARGFTILELVITIAIVVGLTAAVIIFFNKLENSKSLSTDATSVVGLLTDARARTLAAENDSQYGVHFTSSTATLFTGGTYSSTDPNNQVVALSSRDTLSVTVTGGGSDVIFQRLTGETSSSTVVISLISSLSNRKTITVSQLGVIALK